LIMADDVDLAQIVSDMYIKIGLQNSKTAPPVAIATGECLFCEAHLPPGVRWCGAECRDDWQAEQGKL
jgi:hypothetical protein